MFRLLYGTLCVCVHVCLYATNTGKRGHEVWWAFDSEACHNLNLASGQKQPKLCVFIDVCLGKKEREQEHC